MKKTSLFIMLFISFISTIISASAQSISYELVVKDITIASVNHTNDAVDFSIYLRNTTNPALDFVYGGVQFILSFNPEIVDSSNGLNFTKLQSDLPVNLQPRNPMVGWSSYPNVLLMAINGLQGRASSPTISVTPSNENGILIEKMRLRRNSGSFNLGDLNLRWSDPSFPLSTRFYIYDPSDSTTDVVVEITNPSNHIIVSSSPTLNLTTLLEGSYNNGLNEMISDTATVYLRNSSSPYSIAGSSKSVLDINGNGSFVFTNAIIGTSYYIVVKHRNSIETWSSSSISFNTNQLNYDFTTASSQAFGNNMTLKGSRYCIYSGDVNQDGTIDAGDLSNVENDATISLEGYVQSDVSCDNFVDAGDLAIVENNAGAGISAITP